MNQQKYDAGSIIFRPGDPGKYAFLIRTGSVELLRGEEGREVRLYQYGPGDVFGEMSLIEERPHTLTARAVDAVTVDVLTHEQFERMLTADPATFRLYLKALFERLRNLTAREAQTEAPGAEPGHEAPEDSAAEVPAAEYGVEVTIHPLTRRAAETLPDDGLLIPKFPFRIGRASELGEREALDLNDLWLLDREPFNISRNHCAIDVRGHDVFIKDRGTTLGLYVNEVKIGGHLYRRQADLVEGDNVVIMGGRSSPYQFRIHVKRTG